jgi:UDP-N-acetyl-D-galactosamine dehydrogenase
MFVANKVVKILIQKGKIIKGSKILVLGVTFKENCPDIRNSKVVDIYNELIQFGLDVDVYDPHANSDEVKKEYGINITKNLLKYDGIILAVSHNEFLTLNYESLKLNESSIIFDIKAFLKRELVDARL